MKWNPVIGIKVMPVNPIFDQFKAINAFED